MTQGNDELLAKMKKHVDESVSRIVDEKMSKVLTTEDFANYVKGDVEWKQRAEPALTAFESGSTFLKVVIWFLKLLVLLAAGITAGAVIKKVWLK